MDTITSDSGVKYDIVEEMGSRGSFGMHPTGRVYIQKSSQSIGECDHSFDSSLLSNPPIAVCSKCGFQKRESTVSEKQDFGWIYDCAKAIKEYREEEGGRWTTEGIEEIISRHYKHI